MNRTGASIAAVAAIALFVVTPVAADDHDGKHLSVADYLEFEEVQDPQISPDGRQVIYTRRSIDKQKDNWDSALWIMDADGSRHRYLADGGNARWSPSGDRILFIAADDNDKPQLFVRWMEGDGAVSQVTRVTVTPASPEWSPDGQHIAFVAIVPAKDDWQIELPSPPEGAEWAKPPRILDRLHYRQDRIGYTDPGFTHLFVVPAASGTARQLTEGEWNVGAQFDGLYFGAGLSWMPDSESIVFDGWNEPDWDSIYRRSHIYSIDIDRKEIRQLTQETGYWTAPAVSNDGERIAYLGYPASDVTYEMPRVHVMNADGGNARLVTDAFDRPTDTLFWADNDRGVYFSAQDEGYVNVFHMALNGDVRAVTEGKHVRMLNAINGNTGVGIGSSFHQPRDVYSFSLSGRGEPRRLTAVNDDLLDNRTLGEQEEIWYEAPDGNRAHGWIIKPPGFDPEQQYPLLMEIHGGPFAMYTGEFIFNFHVFAANGFVVLYTNPRGSTGYGEEFSQAIDHAYPSVDYLDLMGGVDATIAEGYIDEKRMYVGGCSGGGVLSSWVIGHTDRFAAAAVRCPVSN